MGKQVMLSNQVIAKLDEIKGKGSYSEAIEKLIARASGNPERIVFKGRKTPEKIEEEEESEEEFKMWWQE